MKIAVCTTHSPAYAEVAAVTMPVMEAYCERHGYSFHEIKVEDNKWAYKKHGFFKELFETDVDAVLHIDVDAVFTNFNTKIEDFIDQEHDYFITKDFNELNTGNIILKNTDNGKWINEIILSQIDCFENEQNAVNWLMGNPGFNQRVKIVPHPSLNSYQYSLYKECSELVGKTELGDWTEGCFILHVPALPISKRAEILNDVKIIE